MEESRGLNSEESKTPKISDDHNEKEKTNDTSQLINDLMYIRDSNRRNGLTNEDKSEIVERINEAKNKLPNELYTKAQEIADEINSFNKEKEINDTYNQLVDDLMYLRDLNRENRLTDEDKREIVERINEAKNKLPNELYAKAQEDADGIIREINNHHKEKEINDTYNQLVDDLMYLRDSNSRNRLTDEDKREIVERINKAKNKLSEKKYEEAEKEVDRVIKKNIPFENGKIEDDAYTVMMNNLAKLADSNNNDKDTKKFQEEVEKARQVLPKEYQKIIEDSVQQRFPGKQQSAAKEKISFSSSKDDNQTERKTLQQIMYELQKGLEIKAKSGKRYQASNIKIGKNFKNELKSGNVWYNVVHFGPTLIKSAVAGIKKLTSKFNLWKTEQTHTMDILKDRVENLNDKDLQVIWEEYRGSQVNQDSFTSALNIMLNDKIQRFTQEKVKIINTQIAVLYNQIFADYKEIQAINEKLETPGISNKTTLEKEKESLLMGKAEQIGKLRQLYIQGNNYYSGGGHGFSEDMKAAGTNLSKIGKRFTVKHDYDDSLQAKKAKLEMLEAAAVKRNDNEEAIKAFVAYEELKNKETGIDRSIFGDRSIGKMYYSPLVGEMDYRDDPFIRDIFTTVAMVGAAVSVVNSIHTHVTETNEVLAAEQEKAAQVNGANQQTINQVHQTGQDIANHRDIFNEGMQAHANSDAINILNVGERSASTQSVNAGGGWNSGNVYVQADNLAHETATQAYKATQQQIEDIAAKYSQKLISQEEVTQAFANMAKQSQQTLNETIESALPHLTTYMQTHPQFKLEDVSDAMNYIVQNPNAIPQMYQGMVDVTNMGEKLKGLTIEQVEALQSLPSDMKTTLIGAASSAALAYNCARSTSNRSSAKSAEEQQIIDMVSEYTAEREEKTESIKR